MSPTGITCSQHPDCSECPALPWDPEDCQEPQSCHQSQSHISISPRSQRLAPSLHPWSPQIPPGCQDSGWNFTPFILLPMENREVWGAGGELQPPQTCTDTHSDPAGVGKKGSRLGSFPELLPPQPNPFGHSPNPTGSGPGVSHSGQDTVPTEGLGVPWRGGKGLPSLAPSQSRCRVGTARPKRAGGARRGLGHNVTAAAATEGHSDRDRNSRARPGPGGPLAPHSPGVAAIRKNLEALARPAEARDRSVPPGKPARREGSPRQAGKHAGIFVLSSPGKAVPELRERAEPERRLGRRELPG